MTTMMKVDPEQQWLREAEREYRQEVTSSKITEGAFYVFDEAAVAACDDDTKIWIESTVAAGYGAVVKGNLDQYLTMEDCGAYGRVLEDVSELIEGLLEDDVISSLRALFVACSDNFVGADSLFGQPVFVTGNKKMLKLMEEEGSREEIHAAAEARAFPGVRHYMFIDNEGEIARVNLKWDDPTRPSDQRALAWARGLQGASSSLESRQSEKVQIVNESVFELAV